MLRFENDHDFSDNFIVQKLLSTTEFAQAVGISNSSARRLADNGQIAIHKTSGGHRKIPLAEAIRYVRENGITPQDPALLGIAVLKSASKPGAFYKALIAGDGNDAVRVLQTLYLQGKAVTEICDGPVFTAMGKIGLLFPDDKRSIFIEHRAIVICLQALMQLKTLMPVVNQNAPKAICGAPSGDPYLLPSLVCSLVLNEAGFRDVNLGPDMPLNILIDSVEDESPRIICLSITSMIHSRSQMLEIEKLNCCADRNGCKLIIGGQSAHLISLPDVKLGRSMAELKTWATGLSLCGGIR